MGLVDISRADEEVEGDSCKGGGSDFKSGVYEAKRSVE